MTLPPNGPSHGSVDISEEPPAGAKRGRELNSSCISEGNEFERSLTLTVTSFFSSAFPSGNFSPKHMLMVYSGDPPLFSLNSFSSVHRQDAQQQQMRQKEVEVFYRHQQQHLPCTYLAKLRSSTMLFWGSLLGSR